MAHLWRACMERVDIAGITLEYEVSESGEPMVLIHGALIADTFRPLLAEPSLTDRYQLIAYHRRGYGGSTHTPGPLCRRHRPGLPRRAGAGRTAVSGSKRRGRCRRVLSAAVWLRVPRAPRSGALGGFRASGCRCGDLVRTGGARAAELETRRGGFAADHATGARRARGRERYPLAPIRRDPRAVAELAAKRGRIHPPRRHAFAACAQSARHGRGVGRVLRAALGTCLI